MEQLLRDKQIGPLEGFRSKAGWPFTAEIVLKYNEEEKNWKLEFDFGDDKNAAETGEIVDFSGRSRWAPARSAARRVFEYGKQLRLRERRAARQAQPTPTLRLQERQDHPAAAGRARADEPSCWPTGKTDLLDKFVSMRTRRPFKAFLAWDKEAGKVNFEFDAVQVPAAQGRGRQDARCEGSRRRSTRRPPRRPRRAAKKAAGEEGAGEESRRAEGTAQDRPPASSPAPSWPP